MQQVTWIAHPHNERAGRDAHFVALLSTRGEVEAALGPLEMYGPAERTPERAAELMRRVLDEGRYAQMRDQAEELHDMLAAAGQPTRYAQLGS